jgi:hypothetical protein
VQWLLGVGRVVAHPLLQPRLGWLLPLLLHRLRHPLLR